MMFNQDSGLVQVWKDLILSGEKSIDDIPNIKNLKEEIVKAINQTE